MLNKLSVLAEHAMSTNYQFDFDRAKTPHMECNYKKWLFSYHRVQSSSLYMHLRAQTAIFSHTWTSVWKSTGRFIPTRSATFLHARLSVWKGGALRAQVRVQVWTLHNLTGKIVFDIHGLCRCSRTRFFVALASQQPPVANFARAEITYFAHSYRNVLFEKWYTYTVKKIISISSIEDKCLKKKIYKDSINLIKISAPNIMKVNVPIIGPLKSLKFD